LNSDWATDFWRFRRFQLAVFHGMVGDGYLPDFNIFENKKTIIFTVKFVPISVFSNGMSAARHTAFKFCAHSKAVRPNSVLPLIKPIYFL